MSAPPAGVIASVDRLAPGGAFNAPSGSVSGVITPAVTVTDNDKVASVQFKVDGANVGSLVTVAPWQISYDTRGKLNGAHTYTAVITDRVGNQTTITASAVTHANPPVVTITSPANGGSYPGTWVYSASVTHYSTSVSSQFHIDGGVNNTLGGTSPSYSFDSHYLSAGWHSFRVLATDAGGLTGEQTFSAHVANTVPAAGWLYWGNLMSWWGESWDEGQTSCPYPQDRWNGSLDADMGGSTWWSAHGEGAGAYPYGYLPGNPNPTYYQMRIQGYAGNLQHGAPYTMWFTMVVNGGEYESWVNGPESGFWGLMNVGGGDNIRWLRYADSREMGGHTTDIRIYYDFVIKAGYAS